MTPEEEKLIEKLVVEDLIPTLWANGWSDEKILMVCELEERREETEK